MPRGIQAAETRHRVVQDDQVWTQTPREAEGGRAVVGLTDDRDLVLFSEERAEALANSEMIVGDENADHRSWPPLLCALANVPNSGCEPRSRRPAVGGDRGAGQPGGPT